MRIFPVSPFLALFAETVDLSVSWTCGAESASLRIMGLSRRSFLELYSLADLVADAPPGAETVIVVERIVDPPIEPGKRCLGRRRIEGAEGPWLQWRH
jgi:hypothetical protein